MFNHSRDFSAISTQNWRRAQTITMVPNLTHGSKKSSLAYTGRLWLGITTEVGPMLAVRSRMLARGLICVAGVAALACTGCQVDVGGQTLPSPYYLSDDIQYFPVGPRMKLSQEAAAMKAFREEEALRAAQPAQPAQP
jgi:hypothetical protein